jgi:magnesium-transporting ATPase (P-type)
MFVYPQVSHVLSDKTGTLTENKMIFRKCYVGGTSYIEQDRLEKETHNHHPLSIPEDGSEDDLSDLDKARICVESTFRFLVNFGNCFGLKKTFQKRRFRGRGGGGVLTPVFFGFEWPAH